MSVAARVSQEMGVKLGNEVRRSTGPPWKSVSMVIHSAMDNSYIETYITAVPHSRCQYSLVHLLARLFPAFITFHNVNVVPPPSIMCS